MTIRYSSLTGLSGICLAIWMLVGTPLTVTGAGDSDAPTVGESRQTRSLNGVWKFCAPMEELEYRHEFLQDGLARTRSYPADEPDKNYGWIEPDFDDAVWWDIDLPSSWNVSFPDLWSYEGLGWYRKEVAIPEAWKNKRVVFHSDGANYRIVLYVNGTKVGVHEGGYVAFSFPIHEQLKFGEVNTIAVSVDNKSLIDRCPMERHDWWTHGGLYRPLRLEVTDKVFVDNAVVVTDALSDPPRVSINADIVSERTANTGLELQASLIGPDGAVAARALTPLTFQGANAKAELALDVKDALLWSPDAPNLYDLAVEVRESQSGLRRDLWERRIGIRTIQFDGPQLLVNGKPFYIQGINRYENYADTGMTPNDSALRRDIHLIKSIGGNAVRCHYTYSPETYDRLDEEGLFAVCEVPLYQWGRPGHSTKNLDAAKVQLREMIQTLRNHPSVMMWSVSNETRTRPSGEGEKHRLLSEMVVKGNLELVGIAHEMDPTRPAIEPSNRWPDDPVFEATDIHAVNVYFGVSKPHVDALPELRKTLHERLTALRELHPDKPILASEVGGWSLWGFKADYYPGEIYQAELLRTYWEAFRKEPNFVGGFIWCFADSDVHRKYTRITEMRCAYGIFDIHRRPKEAVRVMREVWGGPAAK